MGKDVPGERQRSNQTHESKVYVFSDSVSRVGKMREFPHSNDGWTSRLQWFKNTKQHRELDGIGGEPMEF